MSTQHPTLKSGGLCSFCGQELARSAMSRHVGSCKQRTRGTAHALLIMVQDPYWPHFWLHVLAPLDATLGDLDRVLRDTWLECCGHMSEFEIDGTRYRSQAATHGRGAPAKPMDSVGLQQVLPPKTKFKYDYDFGSTTRLKGHCVRVLNDAQSSQEPQVVARNLLLHINCKACRKNEAEFLDVWGESGALCKACYTRALTDGTVDDEGIMPVVNSPRMGVCEYGI